MTHQGDTGRRSGKRERGEGSPFRESRQGKLFSVYQHVRV